MISAADFDDLFPHMSRRRCHSAPRHALKSAERTSIPRWEDNGGRTRYLQAQGVPRSMHHDGGTPDPVRDGIAFAMIPVKAACAASARTTDPIWVSLAFTQAAFAAALDAFVLQRVRPVTEQLEKSSVQDTRAENPSRTPALRPHDIARGSAGRREHGANTANHGSLSHDSGHVSHQLPSGA